MGVHWTTIPTREYFQSLKNEYIRIKGNTPLVSDFMERVRLWFFDRYKTQVDELKEREAGEEASDAVQVFASDEEWRVARVKGIKYWFLNNTKKEIKELAGIGSTTIKITLGAEAGGSGARNMTNEQVYSKLFYSERVREEAEAEIDRTGANKAQQLSVRNRVTRERFEQESDEIKAEVKQKRFELMQEREEREAAIRLLQDGNRGRLNYEELASVQKHIPKILEMFFDEIHAKTGWCFHMQGGGPQVATPNAPIKYTSYSVGVMDGKETFETWARKEGMWKDHWRPFSAFVHHLFPERVRLHMAISIDKDTVSDESVLQEAGRLPGRLQFSGDPAKQEGGGAGSVPNPCVGKTSGQNAGSSPGTSGGNSIDRGIPAQPNQAQCPSSDVALEPAKSSNAGPPVITPTVPGPIHHPANPARIPTPDGAAHAVSGRRPATKGKGKERGKGKKGKGEGKEKGEGEEGEKEERGVSKNSSLAEVVDDDGGAQPTDPPSHTQPDAINDGVNPFNIPPILDVWATSAAPHQQVINSSPAHWGSGAQQEGSLLAELTGNGPQGIPAFDSTGELGAGAYNYGTGYESGYRNGGGYGGADGGGYSSGYGGYGDLNIDMTTLDLETRYGMSEAMFDLAGNNVPGFDIVGAVEEIPVPKVDIINPNFQVSRGIASGGQGGSDDILGEQGVSVVPVANNGQPAAIAGGKGDDDGNSDDRDYVGGEAGDMDPVVGEGKEVGVGGTRGRKRELGFSEPNQERGKRARTAKKQPEWIDQARQHLLEGLNSEKWVDMVNDWYEWEVRCSGLGGVMNGVLPAAAARPPVIKRWLDGGCQWGAQENLTQKDILVFKEKWLKWWNAMQPKARRSEDGEMPHPIDDTMTRGLKKALTKAGENGFVLLLRALKMWVSEEGANEEWENMVEDVRACIQVIDRRA